MPRLSVVGFLITPLTFPLAFLPEPVDRIDWMDMHALFTARMENRLALAGHTNR